MRAVRSKTLRRSRTLLRALQQSAAQHRMRTGMGHPGAQARHTTASGDPKNACLTCSVLTPLGG